MMRGSEDFRTSGMKASATQAALMVLVSMIWVYRWRKVRPSGRVFSEMPALLMRRSRRPYFSCTAVTALEMEESEVTSSSIGSRERPEGREAIVASHFVRERLLMRIWYVGFSVASFLAISRPIP